MKKYQSPEVTRKQIEFKITQILTTFAITENYKMIFDIENDLSEFIIDEIYHFTIVVKKDGRLYIEPIFKSPDRIIEYNIKFKINQEYTPEHLYDTILSGIKMIIKDYENYHLRKIEEEAQKEIRTIQNLEFDDIKKFLEKKLRCTVDNRAYIYETFGYTVDNYFGTCYPFIIQDTGDEYKISSVGYGSVDGDTDDYWANKPIEEIIENNFVLEYDCYTASETDDLSVEEYHVDKKFYTELSDALKEYNEKHYINLNY